MGAMVRLVLCVVCLLVIYAECEAADAEASRGSSVLKKIVELEKLKDVRGQESDKQMKVETHKGRKTVDKAFGGGQTNKKEDKAETLPNIVIFLADDLGYGDLSFSGHPTSRTPSIDLLASQSRIFTHHYVTSPICSPSRASLLTGRLQVRSGVYPEVFLSNSTLGLPHNETTIAALLKGKGYRTMIAGKWHLGVGGNGEYLPAHFGFDDYLGLPYPQDFCPCYTCFPGPLPCHDTCYPETLLVSCPLYRNTTIVEQPADITTLTPRLVDAATSFITDAATSQTPFFLYFPFHHIHHPQFASEKFAFTSTRGIVGDALEELDWAVGEVLVTLAQHELLSSTLIWFSSDNGPSLMRQERGGCAGLLRCGKGTTWEGGVRVPLFVSWPPYIHPGRSDGLVSALDLLPTLAFIAGLNTSGLTLDGTDISPLLWDPHAPSPRKYMPIYPIEPAPAHGPLAVTNGTYKAHFYTQGSYLSDPDNYDSMCPSSHPLTKHDPPLLYNLHRDPGERYDLSGDPKYSDVISDLAAWRDDHMKTVTWMEPLTMVLNNRSQPCCTDPSCSPFPQCCDCPTTTTPAPPTSPPQVPPHP